MTTAHFPNSPGAARPGAEGYESDTGVKDQAQQAAGTAAEQGKHVAGTARDEAQNVAAEAKNQARNLMSEATTQVDEQSRVQKDRLAETVRSFSDDLQGMASQGNGLAAEIAQQVAERARSISSQLESKDPQDLLADVRTFARQRPGTFLLGALAAGVVAGRLTRGAKAAQSGTTSTIGTTGTTGGSNFAGSAPFAADVTSPADPLTTGAAAPSSGPAFESTSSAGTATGDPLAGTHAEDSGPTTYPNAPETTTSTWTSDPSQPGGRP